jgi:hypothetical protein
VGSPLVFTAGDVLESNHVHEIKFMMGVMEAPLAPQVLVGGLRISTIHSVDKIMSVLQMYGWGGIVEGRGNTDAVQ